jgi:hypothetical protein
VENYDYFGFDLSAPFPQTPSINVCAERCITEPRCHYCTLAKWGECYLKGAGTGNNGTVSVFLTGRCTRPDVPTTSTPATTTADVTITTADATTTADVTTTTADATTTADTEPRV